MKYSLYNYMYLLIGLLVSAFGVSAQVSTTVPAACATCPAPACTAPAALVCQAAASIPAGSTATSTVTGGTGGTLTWAISPTTGVSTTSGSGSTTGAITFATAGTYTVTFTSTNNSNPASCSPAASVTCSRTLTVTPQGSVSAFNCSTATPSPVSFRNNGSAYSGTVTLSYTGGSGGPYAAGSVASTGVTGFTASWAAGTIATGSGTIPITITGSSTTAGIATFPITIGGQTCSISIASCGAFIAPSTFKEFLCHNLGADITADPHNVTVSDAWKLNGAYIQWGKRGPNITGDSRVDWQTAPTNGALGFVAAPTATNPGGGVFFSGGNAPNYAWRTSGGAKTANDPCPTGYRVPTRQDWQNVLNNSVISRTGTFNESLTNYGVAVHLGTAAYPKLLTLPISGVVFPDGSLIRRGFEGYYSCSTEDDLADLGSANDIVFFSVLQTINVISRSCALVVRCIAE